MPTQMKSVTSLEKRAYNINYTYFMQGKLGYRDGTIVDWEGNPVAIPEVEQKITLIHGGE